MNPTTEPPQQTLPQGRLDYIDALRGAASLWVLLHHSNSFGRIPQGWWNWPLHLLAQVQRMGWLGVSLFLVLSGFCLYYPLVRRDEPAAIRLNLKLYALRRTWRILPPYYVALLVYVAYHVADAVRHHESVTAAIGGKLSVPLHFLLLHNLYTRTFSNLCGAFWSIALEAQLYLLFPLFILLVRRKGFKALLSLTFVIAVLWQTAVYARLGLRLDWNSQYGTWYHALPARAFEFALGMFAAALVARPPHWLTSRSTVLLLLVLVPAIWYGGFVSRFGPLLDQTWGVLFACVLVLCHQIPASRIRRNWLLRALVGIGTISYSLYLIHSLLFMLIHLPETQDWHRVPLMLGRMLLAIAVGVAFFWAFERPFLIRRRHATASELAQAAALSPAP